MISQAKTFLFMKALAEKDPEKIKLYGGAPKTVETLNRIGDVLAAIAVERTSQGIKWGEQKLPDRSAYKNETQAYWLDKQKRIKSDNEGAVADRLLSWQSVLFEEVAEVFAEDDPQRIAEELVQVAAVCISWIEALAAREEDNG